MGVVVTDMDVEVGTVQWPAAPTGTVEPGPPPRPVDPLRPVARAARRAGLHRIHVVAWRDLDDPEAGGSELHAHHIASRWADAGLDVTMRASAVADAPSVIGRSGYRAIRKSGRYMVFPRSALSGAVSRRGRPDALVEVWNGMPFLSPLWARCTRVVFLHHVHAEMWRMTLPPALARVGEMVERRLAPPVYRRTRVVTLSESARREIVAMLGLRPERVAVVPPGVDPRFAPGPGRSPTPLVLVVGRLVPVKRLPMLVDALVAARARVPDLRAVVVGEGYARPEVEAVLRRTGAEHYVELVGRCDEDELVELYRRAWVLASASQREGWGMTISEAAACGTPAVVTRIAGHRDAVAHGESGLLVDDSASMADALVAVLRDRVLRERLRRGALAAAGRLSWEATAARTLELVVAEHVARRASPWPPLAGTDRQPAGAARAR